MWTRTVMAAALLAGCARPVPLISSRDPALCIRDAGAVPSLVAPQRNKIGLCYGEEECFLIEHVLGEMINREDPIEFGVDADLQPPDFNFQRIETHNLVCGGLRPCREVQLPGVEDPLTVTPAVSVNGLELYYVVREGDRAFLDTVTVEQPPRRLAHIPLPVANARDHVFDVTRVGSAVLVRDTIAVSVDEQRSTRLLVDPFTGVKRVVANALELDAEAALVLEAHRVTIVSTRGLATLATHELPANSRPPSAGITANLAAFAYGSPPTFVIVTKRAFTRTWRLPVCQ